jgi:hypothetical protein
VLDLRSVTFIDSTGMSLIVAELKKVNIDFAVIPGTATATSTLARFAAPSTGVSESGAPGVG